MSSLLVTKEYIKQIYAKNQAYIDPVLKFLMAMIVFLLINVKMGYMEKLNSMVIVLVLALFCSLVQLASLVHTSCLMFMCQIKPSNCILQQWGVHNTIKISEV